MEATEITLEFSQGSSNSPNLYSFHYTTQSSWNTWFSYYNKQWDTSPHRPLSPPPPSPNISKCREKQMKGNETCMWKRYRLYGPMHHLLWHWYCDVNVEICCFESLDFSLLWPSAVWIWQYFLSWQKKSHFLQYVNPHKGIYPKQLLPPLQRTDLELFGCDATGVLDFDDSFQVGVWWAPCVTCLVSFCQVE